jgi:Glycosyl transferases group 1/Glycosyltransferase Family 4
VRILHIDTGKDMRGGQHQVMLLLQGLQEAGHESVLLARADGALYRAAKTAGFTVHAATLGAVWWHSRQSAIVHAQDARGHTLAALGTRGRFVVSRRVAFPIKRGLGSRWKYARAARFLAVSRWVAQELGKAGIGNDKIDVVFDGVMPMGEGAAWSAEYPAVALASHDPQKGRDLVERAAQAAGIRVVFSDDLPQDLKRASMFVYVTRSEGLGSAALLAMQMGVPVIASRVGGLPEVVEDGETGVLVENDAAQIAAAMGALRADSRRTLAFIEKARERVEGTFGAGHLVQRTLAAYGRALAG